MCESVFNKCSRQSSQTDTDEMLSNHMTCETVNSEVGVVKSSNCIINIEYMVQDEKIVFEVFKSTVDSNCVLKRNIVLNKSNDPSNDIKEFISSLSETASYGSMKINKSCQTDPVDLVDSEPKKRTKSPRNKKVAFECPEKDTTGKIDGTEYKEIYAVSSFKFVEPKATVVSATKQNFCALEFDGTKSRKHRHSAKKQTNLTKVKSDTNILRVSNNLLKEKTDNCISEKVTSELTDANENNLKKEIKKKRHKSVEPTHKKQYGEHVKSDGAQFEIVLTPRKPKNLYRLEKDTETIDLSRRKPRKIIVKSNTLELLTKPEMKSVALQTTPSCFLEKNILLKDLYAKPYFNTVSNIKSLKSMDSGDANLEEVNLQQEEEVKPHNYKTDVKKFKRRPFGELNLTKTVNPCIEIKNGPEHIEFPQKIRPTIPRRRIDAYESGADENITVDKLKMETPVPSVRTKIPRLREGTTHLINDTVITEDLNTLRTHITSWLTNNRKQNVNTEEYNKEIDELCSKITSLLHHPNEENVVKKENVEKSEKADSKSPREKSSAMKHETKRNVPLAKPVNNTVMQKTKSPRLQICHNTNVVIASENLAQNKLIDADEQKTIMRTAFRREMSNVSSKSAKSNKNDTKPVIPQNKNDEQSVNKNSILRNENYPYTNLSKRLRYEAKCQMQEEEKQQKSNTTANKSFASKKYEHTRINEQFFEQCMASRKRHNAFLSGTSSVTVNSQEKSTITSGQKRKSGIPLRSRTFTELTKPNTASTKPDMLKTNARCLSRNSLDTNVSDLSKIKEPSLKQSKSAIFNSQNFEEFKTKTKCSTVEKSRPQNPGSIVNSTFLFTKVNMDSNAMSCFRKRKEYSNNLKLKKRIQSEEQSSDVKQVTNRNKIQTSFKRKYTPPRPCLLPKFRQMSKYTNVSNIFAHMQEESDSKTVKTSAPDTTNCTVQPTDNTDSVLPTNKEKSSLFPYHFKPANCDDDYESLSDNDSTVPFLKPYPLVENSQVFMATNVKTSVKSKCKKPSINNNTNEQLKPKVSLTKSTSKPRLSTKRASLSLKPKATRTSIKCNKEKNTTYAKQLEMRKALLGEIKACCSLCCKQNKESDSTFKKNTENNENQKMATERTGLIGILKNSATSKVNTKKKSVKINETPQSIYKEDEEDIALEPKVSYEYWRCAVAQNSPFAHKFLDNEQKSSEKNKVNNVSNSITDDDMTFYSSQSIAINKPAISNSEDLHTDTTDSFKSTLNTHETSIENEALKVLLDKNQKLHRTESDPDSEYALVCTLNKSENKNKMVEQVDSGKLLEAKKSNIFKNINKFFRKKGSKTKCNTNNVS